MKAIVGVVFAIFVSIHLYALETAGISGLVTALTQGNAWHLLIGVDLLIALGLVSTWLWRDARSRGSSPLLYLLITAVGGSLGPLLYLLGRPSPSASK